MFFQALVFAAGFLCVDIGASIIGGALRRQLQALRVEGTIIGVRRRGNIIYNVYRYMLPSTGETLEATSGHGSLRRSGHDTGRRVTLLLFPEDPAAVKEAGSPADFIVGLAFFLPGLLLVWYGAARFPLTAITVLVTAGAAIYVALNLFRIAVPAPEFASVLAWRTKDRLRRDAEMEALPLRRFEDVPFPAYRATPEEIGSRRRMAPVLLFAGACLIAFSLYTGGKLAFLLEKGLRAPGVVWDNEYRQSSGKIAGGGHYYAVISFRDHKSTSHSFYDRFGADPPIYEEGEKVTVLYHADDAKDSAIIDRGIFNWLVPMVLALFGAAALRFGVRFYRAGED